MLDMKLFFFNRNELVSLASQTHENFLKTELFPHVVFDHFLPGEVANQIAELFTKSDFTGFKQPDNVFQKNKLGRTQESFFEGLDPFIRHVLNEFNSLAFIDFLENLTGIQGFIPDSPKRGARSTKIWHALKHWVPNS